MIDGLLKKCLTRRRLCGSFFANRRVTGTRPWRQGKWSETADWLRNISSPPITGLESALFIKVLINLVSGSVRPRQGSHGSLLRVMVVCMIECYFLTF